MQMKLKLRKNAYYFRKIMFIKVDTIRDRKIKINQFSYKKYIKL